MCDSPPSMPAPLTASEETFVRTALSKLDGRHFDVLIIGGGISGTPAAQHLAGAGYSVCLVEKNDFASATTSRSGRLLHCGLRYLAPSRSFWEFLQPQVFAAAFGTAKRSMEARGEFVLTTPERAHPIEIAIPIFEGAPYSGWQIDLGARLLQGFNKGKVPLEYRRVSATEGRSHPFARGLRDGGKLSAVVVFRDYQFDWPERICIDAALDAERLGAVIRNYTAATSIERLPAGGWKLGLIDTLSPPHGASVTGNILLNMTGTWIDQLNRQVSPPGEPKRKIVAVKGVHLLAQLAPEYRGYGIAGMNRQGEQIFCVPWAGSDKHVIGVTETVYEGNLDDVRPEEADIAFLLEEITHFIPALKLKRADVQFAWAGARPITYDPMRIKGRRLPFSVLQDLTNDGLPGAFAITWATIMLHRSAGREVVKAIQGRLKPSREKREISYKARQFPDDSNSPPLLETCPHVKIADLRFAAEHEHAQSLVDLLFRRTGLGWRTAVPAPAVMRAAEAVADILGWDEAKVAAEAQSYLAYVQRYHLQG
jgi:glycerol-3-phosphate dehydrogenase